MHDLGGTRPQIAVPGGHTLFYFDPTHSVLHGSTHEALSRRVLPNRPLRYFWALFFTRVRRPFPSYMVKAWFFRQDFSAQPASSGPSWPFIGMVLSEAASGEPGLTSRCTGCALSQLAATPMVTFEWYPVQDLSEARFRLYANRFLRQLQHENNI